MTRSAAVVLHRLALRFALGSELLKVGFFSLIQLPITIGVKTLHHLGSPAASVPLTATSVAAPVLALHMAAATGGTAHIGADCRPRTPLSLRRLTK